MVGWATMHQLWPLPEEHSAQPLTDADLEQIYGYPVDLTEPWVQANFVCSADGAVTVADRSEGLSNPADKRIFALGRDLADVVLVGAGTVRTENYRGVKVSGRRIERRRALGLAGIPPVAVVSGRCAIEPDAALLTDAEVAPIIMTTRAAPAERKQALRDAGAQVLDLGEHEVDPKAALGALKERNLLRINCEGGPHLFSSLVTADLVDQLCLTVAPLLAGPGPDRIVAGAPADAPHRMRLASLLHEDGFCMFRYRRSS